MSLPNAQPIIISPEITIQPPLTRRGTGPGLILAVPPAKQVESENRFILKYGPKNGNEDHSQKTLDPEPLKKWAEEGYAVVQVTCNEISRTGRFGELVGTAITELGKVNECEGVEKVGLVVYVEADPNGIAFAITANPRITCCVNYGDFNPIWAKDISVPILAHLPGPIPQRSKGYIQMFGEDPANLKAHYYPDLKLLGSSFALPSSVGFNPNAASVAHTRSLTFLKPLLGGPYFDLEAIWDEHTKYEFEDRSVEKTMATMVDQPYVNHIPTLTGGIGRENLTKFYRDHFIHSNAEDAQLELVSRTVGIDRIVDEFLFNFTHNRVVDWLIPGIPPTHRKVSIPFTSIVNIRGDRLYHEHIAWDQGTVLRQLGLLPEYLPFPYALPDGRQPGEGGKRFEYRVPVAGLETAKKLVDENAVESNEMLGYEVREVPGE
ncbi:hypothetical protein N0V85_003661 [Neurospora sp. IMI 360204]|nr:hypothetical protein N0V85_003661 [Neurospora sp. IMI 360204]